MRTRSSCEAGFEFAHGPGRLLLPVPPSLRDPKVQEQRTAGREADLRKPLTRVAVCVDTETSRPAGRGSAGTVLVRGKMGRHDGTPAERRYSSRSDHAKSLFIRRWLPLRCHSLPSSGPTRGALPVPLPFLQTCSWRANSCVGGVAIERFFLGAWSAVGVRIITGRYAHILQSLRHAAHVSEERRARNHRCDHGDPRRGR